MEIKEMIELMKAVSENGLTRLELERGDTRLILEKEKQVVEYRTASPVYVEDSMVYTKTGDAVETNRMTESKAELSEAGKVIKSPLVGTFYAAPSPDAENFVKVGDQVKKGQVVAIVEAMKLMNEIESEFDGVVEAILIDNETVVEYGQPLFRIR